MLVLSRKQGEKICIGNGITVIVNRIAGGRVTLAIDAPVDVKILRGELSPRMPVAEGPATPTTSGNTMPNSTTTTMLTAPVPPAGGPPTVAIPSILARRAMLPPMSPHNRFSDGESTR